MLGLAIAAGWVAAGAIAVAVMRKRGHDAFSWAVLFLLLGPIAVPLAISSDRHRPAEPARPLPPGGLDVLVSDDGTLDARAALESAMTLLGAQMTSMTLAAIVDLEAPSTIRGRNTQREAEERLDALAQEVAALTSAPVATVVLYGEPATALQHYALENGYEVIVTGSGSSKAHAAARRARKTVPVLIGPCS